jgi:hypothetical protein
MIATSCSTMLHIMHLVAVKEISVQRASDPRPDATLLYVTAQFDNFQLLTVIYRITREFRDKWL